MTSESEITETIIGCAFDVLNSLGVGFLEKVYENALSHSLRKAGVGVEQQKPISVLFDGVKVGEYFPDMLIEGRVIVEIKASKAIADEHVAQVLNYLKATGLQVGLILNFGTTRLGIKRLVL
jgi:GxxExxY protein